MGLWVLPLFGDRNPFPFLESAVEGQFSPNRQWVAYISPVGVETEKPNVYVRSFPSSENKWRMSTGGGYSPRWHRDGKELFYLAPGDKLMSVQINAGLGTSLEVGLSKLLFEIHNLEPRGGARHSYAVSADGQYFYLLISDYSAVQANVVVNWTANLQNR